MSETPLYYLKKYWNHSNFYSLQNEIITSVLEKEDSVVVLPTGAGKSICFQLPALLQKGSTLVISPLISLIESQVTELKTRGIKTLMLNSSQQWSEQLDNIKFGKYDLIYASPEKITHPQRLATLVHTPIECIAIDEAHCISEWGNDFRPSYLELKKLREFLPKANMIALTATATPLVTKEIERLLTLRQPKIFKSSFERKNINIQTIQTKDKISDLISIFKNHKKSAIVYCRTRQETEFVHSLFNKYDISNNFFHGGLSYDEKVKRLKKWQTEKVKVMVATIAFGMGIDKKNVPLIVHYSLPNSIESYYQEIGRAGRDGAKSKAVLLLENTPVNTILNNALHKWVTPEILEKTYRSLYSFLQLAKGEKSDHVYSFLLETFCNKYKLLKEQTEKVLLFLKKEQILNFKSKEEVSVFVKCKVSPSRLKQFLPILSAIEFDVSDYLLRSYEEIESKFQKIDLKNTAYHSGLSSSNLKSLLFSLQEKKIIEYQEKKEDVVLKWLEPLDEHTLLPQMLSKFKKNYLFKKEKFKAFVLYAYDTEHCKTRQILQYFGEEKKENCQHCSASCCQQVDLRALQESILNTLEERPLTVKEMKEQFPFEEKEVLRELLEKMIYQKKIVQDTDLKIRKV